MLKTEYNYQMKEMQSITRRERGLAVSSNEANGAVSTQKEAR